ncbi:YbhB/YbcL family Raf kinase inhibitor-like protein [Sphingomonas sp.]|uniref:YbhB/YbcL family Raf kinase inhibitor-like protein n=1 Tax=Sphingomonas sp. TaxID=28214 RepID=UPI003CC667E7
MLEHVPAWLGRALASVRAGADKLVIAQPGMAGEGQLSLTSPAFADGARLPERFTADGAKNGGGVSPPLLWTGVPDGATLALIVEDPDAPAVQPLVHCIVWGLDAAAGGLGEGAITAEGEAGDVGRSSLFRVGWLPPDPPTGHGEHRYVFQLFALAAASPDPKDTPGRSALVEVMRDRVLASAVLVGTYSRGEPAAIGPVAAAAPA